MDKNTLKKCFKKRGIDFGLSEEENMNEETAAIHTENELTELGQQISIDLMFTLIKTNRLKMKMIGIFRKKFWHANASFSKDAEETMMEDEEILASFR